MSATFTAGCNWGVAGTQTLTASLLATFINGTITTNIGTTELDDGAKPLFSGLSDPAAPRLGDLKFDLSHRMVNRYDGTRFQPIFQGRVMFNTGVTLVVGAIVAHGTTSNSVSRNATQRWAGLFGTSATIIGQNMLGLIRYNGIGSVLVTATCTAGDVLMAHGIGGVGGAAQSVTDPGSGGFADLSNLVLCDFAIALYNNAGAAGTVTCLIYR